MARYVDGFVLAVPKKNVAAYRRMAQSAGKIWKKHGALEYVEAVGDDLRPKGMMAGVAFPKIARAKPGETVVFAFIVYRSRAHRDRVNAKVMKDPSMDTPPPEMPFDMKRMSYGGFRTLVDL